MDSILNHAVGKISELVQQEAKFLHGVEDQVESMQQELTMMNNFLIRIEAIDDESGDELLRSTAKQIRRIAYDAENVIESYILKVVNPAKNKKDFLRRYLSFCECLVNTHKAGAEIDVIKTRIDRTMKLLEKYGGDNGLLKVVGEVPKKPKVWRAGAYSGTQEDHVVGIHEDINRLVGLLTSNESKIQVLTIVGMGGSGKTTLVRKLFNHESVEQCFDSKAWAPISQQWVAQQGLLDLFKRICGNVATSDDPQEALEKIYKYLEKKKYLIVLDDVWAKPALESILPALPMGNKGSKIIVTTRVKSVVDFRTLKVSIHEPKELTAKESWELFRKIALRDAEETISPTDRELAEMEALGKEMLNKCKGLPLAIVALAGVLAGKDTLEEWEKVSKAMSSRLMEDGEVKGTLLLSYNDLPRYLKPCFLYLGLFPEDSEIPIGMIIRMWIAEGFISSESLEKGQTLEDKGREYMNELIGRCVVRVAERNYDGKPKTIEIHDLMRDLCIKKAKELDFLETTSAESSDRVSRVSQTRRMVVHSYEDKKFSRFSTNNRHLRSLFLFAIPDVGHVFSGYGEKRAQLSILPILKNFKLLRVLNLVSIKTSDRTLPTEIGSLILLRYLGLRATNINELPSSIGNLRNLLTLDYRNIATSEGGIKIPNAVWEIEGLRHIYLPCDPQEGTRFDTLHQLQTLWLDGAGSWITKELPKLSRSVRKLHVDEITSNEQLQAVFQCPSIKFDCLHSLYLSWVKYERTVESESESEGEGESEGEVASESESESESEDEGEGEAAIESEDKGEGEVTSEREDEGEGEVTSEREDEGDAASESEDEGEGEAASESEDKGEAEVTSEREDEGEELVLQNLEYIANSRYLRNLNISGRIDDRSACFQFPFGIKKLLLQTTKIETEATLEALGRLPNLKVLQLWTDSYMGTKWTCYDGLFPKLNQLLISNLPELEEWSIEKGAMCQLNNLTIAKCAKLKRLPEGLKLITTMKELVLEDMEAGLYRRFKTRY